MRFSDAFLPPAEISQRFQRDKRCSSSIGIIWCGRVS